MASHQGVLTLALTVVLLALPSLTYGITLHVRPTSTNTSCPTQPCQTLSEYAQDPGQYFNDSNLTLQFLPGNHTLDINLIITNIHQLEIHGAMLPTKVVCDSLVGFTFSNIYRVSIDGLAFVTCARSNVIHLSGYRYHYTTYYGLHLQSVQTAEIIDCTFQDSYGSALGVVDSHVVLRDNNFLNNCRLCSNGSCDGYNYQGPRCYGGGVFVQRSNLSISGNTTFSGNSASWNGGGVSAWDSNVDISGNTTFSSNSAGWNGGGVSAWDSNVYISGNTTFSSNSAGWNGGGVSAWDSNVYISGNTTFSSNSAGWNGGGVSAWGSGNVYISGNTTFSNNSASYGGGVSAWHSSNVNISGNTTFSGNSASEGGGVSAGSSNVYISGNTTFSGNSASDGDGGALSALCSNVYISGNVAFSSNSARIGGCIFVQIKHPNYCRYTSTASLNLDGNIIFTNCSATSDGGAIHASGIQLNLSGTNIFNANAAEHFGGGLYVPKSSLNIDGDNNFTANWAGSSGGGIYAQETNISFSGTSLLGSNKAQLDGGGIYADGSNLNFRGDITISSNTAQLGGGIYSDNNTFNIDGPGVFERNVAAYYGGGIYIQRTHLILTANNMFNANLAEEGGGIYAVANSTLSLGGVNTFRANRAHVSGGGIWLENSNLTLSGFNLFVGCVASYEGGAIYSYAATASLTGNNTFESNTATTGGGIHARWSNVSVTNNCNFKHNIALLGGGIYTDSSTFEFNGSIFIGNKADYTGGGIYATRSVLNLHGTNSISKKYIAQIQISPLILAGNKFVANSAGKGGGIYATANSTLILGGVNTFRASRAHISGGGIWLDDSNLALNGFNHFVECAASFEGGAIFMYGATASLTGNNTFESNTATTGGGLHARWSNVRITERSKFEKNIAVFGGGIYTDNSTFEFNGSSIFRDNKANYTGGGIYAARSVLNFLGSSTISKNYAARDGGGIYIRDGSVVNLLGSSNYQGNLAGDTGGGISAFQSSFTLAGRNTFESNKAAEGGGLYAFDCTVNFPGENVFITNSAHNHGGGFTVLHSTLHLNGSTAFKNNSAASGGGMYISASNADIDGRNCFVNNTAESGGGAIYAKDSVVELNGKDLIVENATGRQGAENHASSSTSILQGSSSFMSNFANYGGGIYAERSYLIMVHHNCSYLNNTALRGGAQYFDVNSNFSLHQTAHVHFQDNNATEFGGAIYVEDVPSRSECFFHIQNNQLLDLPLVFEKNTAGMRGSVLYGGLLNKCSFTSDSYTSALELFITSILKGNGDKGHSISSDPTQLCFCNTSKLNCTETTQSRSIYPGQQVEVSVVAIDQSHLPIPALIHTTVRSGNNLIMSETISYETGNNCTSRNYSVTPKIPFNQLEVHPSNKSGNTIHLIVNITFERCPIAFEPSNSTGECICDHRLWQYTNSCKIDRQAILRNSSSTFWLNISYNSGTPEGFIHHPFCPLDYCTTENKYINLRDPDKQCNVNRSGLLCGKCKEGLSLVLGSSQCKECSNNYLALLIPFALAGVLLVILLFILHLTVAAGTFHGLIFYANIVAANHHIFPQSSNNPARIFIAWLNLDLGIQTCFYNGMDAYAKTWLDLVFPVYIWVIVGFLVYISHRSVTVTKLLGSSPVPVLATLFLLSYAKVLRTIIAALSLTVLHYPHKNVMVWIHDANTLEKYIPLALAALLFLLFLFLPYTLLLLLGQWLQTKSHLHLLSWVKSPKLKAILDAYHAPYKPKHRYWTGLLLFIRCALFLVFAFNISCNDSVNLLVISSTTSGIFIWFALSGMVYKSWYLNALELSFILNLGILAVTTIYVKVSGGSQAAVAYTSVGIAFFTFVGIVTYHIYLQIKPKIHNILCHHENRKCHENREVDPGNLEHQCGVTPNIVTHTEVNLRELQSPLDLLDTK